MAKILGADGNPMNGSDDPTRKISAMITTLESAQRISLERTMAAIIAAIEGGWEIGHDKELPTTKVQVTTITHFQKDATGQLKMAQRGVVSLGDDYIPALEQLQMLSEAQAQLDATEPAQ